MMCDFTESPGYVLREHMYARNIRICDLARISGLSRGTIERILCGTGRISPTTASKLALAFQIVPSFWLRVQYEYTLFRMSQMEKESAPFMPNEKDEDDFSDEALFERLSGFTAYLKRTRRMMTR